jgi:hypothetical protein
MPGFCASNSSITRGKTAGQLGFPPLNELDLHISWASAEMPLSDMSSMSVRNTDRNLFMILFSSLYS